MVGKDRYWGFPPSTLAAVNVLVQGTGDHPVVWTFDPHDATNGVSSDHIHDVAEIDGIVGRIQERVRRAALVRAG